jgi:uncharacterized protein
MKKLAVFLALFLSFYLVKADAIPKKPSPARLVNDYSGLLSQSENNALESKLSQFARESSNQIVVVIINDLGGYEPADFAVRLGEKWGVGQADNDNGIVVLIKPGAEGQGRMFIATGFGLEGIIPDAVARRIVDHEFIPSFKQGNYFDGIDKGTSVLMQLAKQEYNAEVYMEQTKPGIGSAVFVIVFMIIIALLSGVGRARSYSRVNGIPFWTAMFLMSGSRNTGSGFGGFSGGSGGFGGFGGGGFGGGGAGGSW